MSVRIRRVWRGWTTPENADTYQELLESEIFPGIAAKGVEGYQGAELSRRDLPPTHTPDGQPEVEFMTVLRFDSWEAVKAFAGPDPSVAYVPESARAVLKRFDDRAAHYEVVNLWPNRLST